MNIELTIIVNAYYPDARPDPIPFTPESGQFTDAVRRAIKAKLGTLTWDGYEPGVAIQVTGVMNPRRIP